ncbi:MAG: MATE family efflux transporter [Peptococcaceae bacterium]|nr:MATE family efflux transporter [Peptococcaceae bacterium]
MHLFHQLKTHALVTRVQRIVQKTPRWFVGMLLPMMIAQMITIFYNTTDTFFAARLGTSAVASVGLVFSIQVILQAIGFGIGSGAGNLVTRALDRADVVKAQQIFNSAMLMAFIGAVALMVPALMVLPDLMRALGATNTMMPFCMEYAQIILLGSPMMCLQSVICCVLLNEGKVFTAVLGLASGVLFNAAMNPLLIRYVGMGLTGAAWATVLGQGVSFVVLLYVFLNQRHALYLDVRSVSTDWQSYREICAKGKQTFCRQGTAGVMAVVLNFCAASFGDAAMASVTLANKIVLVIRNVLVGATLSFQPVAGFHIVSGLLLRLREIFMVSAQLGAGICLVALVLVGLNVEMVFSWLRDNPAVALVLKNAVFSACVVTPLVAYSGALGRVYRFLGERCRPVLFFLGRYGIYLVCAGLILSSFAGFQGMTLTRSVLDVATFMVSLPLQFTVFKGMSGSK